MKAAIKIRFTESQIALLMRAHPNCNLDHLTELSFEFDETGRIIDCRGTIKDGGEADHDYAGRGLARLSEKDRRQLAAGQPSATVLQFPKGEGLAKCIDPGSAWAVKRPTRPTGLGMLEISEAGSAWPSTAASDRGLGRPVAGRGRARGCKTQPSLIWIKAVGIEDGNCEKVTTRMQPTVIV